MSLQSVKDRNRANREAGLSRSYPEHKPKPLPPKPDRKQLPVLDTCVHLGKRLPGQPCGSQLMECLKHNAVTTRFVKCSKADRHCATCPDFEKASAGLTKHLLYHIYPVAGNGMWQWNVDELCKRMSLFNGRRIVAVVTDPATGRKPDPTGPLGPDRHRVAMGTCDTVTDVQDRFGKWADQIEWVEVENDPALREVATFLPLFERLEGNAGPNDVLLYAHAKGTTRDAKHVAKVWAGVLYEVMMDYWGVVADQLKSHPVTGAFRKFGKGWAKSQSTSGWHYSGSWAWFRAQALFSKPDWRRIDRCWTGIEPYPSQHFGSEAGCLFHEDKVHVMNLYNPNYWWTKVMPELERFRAINAGRKTEY